MQGLSELFFLSLNSYKNLSIKPEVNIEQDEVQLQESASVGHFHLMVSVIHTQSLNSAGKEKSPPNIR